MEKYKKKIEGKTQLPVVYPIVVYNGMRNYNHSEEDKMITIAEAWKKEGIEKGSIDTSQKIAERLLCKGMDTASVSSIVEIPKAKIQEMQNNLG